MILAICAVQPALAVPKKAALSFEERFKRADKNGDGLLTKKEAYFGGLYAIDQKFYALDTNMDGLISLEEALPIKHVKVGAATVVGGKDIANIYTGVAK